MFVHALRPWFVVVFAAEFAFLPNPKASKSSQFECQNVRLRRVSNTQRIVFSGSVRSSNKEKFARGNFIDLRSEK
jgi:hypothetical protein